MVLQPHITAEASEYWESELTLTCLKSHKYQVEKSLKLIFLSLTDLYFYKNVTFLRNKGFSIK